MTASDPVRHELDLPLSAADAFALFTQDMARWWPLEGHSCSGESAQQVLFEPRVGGSVVEVAADGKRHPWGALSAWEPPHRFVMTWHPAQEPAMATRLEVCFEDTADGCRLRLTHDGWEVRGDEAPRIRDGYREGWKAVLGCLSAEVSNRERA